MTEIVEFGTRSDANAVRDDHAEHLTGRFDRRFAKVELADNVPDDAADAAGDVGLSLLERLWEVVPLWAWGLGSVVLAGVAYTYTRPLWSVVGGVIPA
ncbi:hypothetical protein DJ82_12230 [Halorubrum sp. Ib24]|uniref:hypothetical protein n=1 Tax=Halorubrum sp. Ib24 TaxID=1383850 RepID=UPI000B982990|nr:hypothetical protein [Halorubrum sp. Ib24]OYR38348.1 hypothetical protein DJ82_12230 [Halorubrum sp. Ib24]